MASMVMLQFALLLALFVLYKVASSHIRERKFKAFAEQHGCKEPRDLTLTLKTRYAHLNRIMKSKKTDEDILDDIIAPDFHAASTFETRAIEGTKMINTVEPANVQAILATQFDDFVIGELRHLQLGPILGKSIFTSDGPFWAHSRALFRPQFSRENINDLKSTERAAKALFAAIGGVDDTGWTRKVDLQPLFYNFTLDTASEFLFGESLESQNARMLEEKPTVTENSVSQAGSQQFREDFEIIGGKLLMRLRLASLYWMSDGLRFRKALRRVKRFTEHYVTAAVESFRAGTVESKKETLLARLATQTQDVEELRNQTLALLLAGRDTTAGLLGFSLMRLALHPDIFAKLRGIILNDFETEGPINFADIKGCRCLQHFFNEVLRLHPTLPINGRVAARDTTLPTGGGPDQKSPIALRKGQTVGYSVYFMHRRKDLWGEDALEFKPQRWEQKIPAWQYLPFNGGPRICLGQQFALVEASYLLVRMLQRYEAIEPVDRASMLKMRKGLGLTMWPRDGVNVRLREAKS